MAYIGTTLESDSIWLVHFGSKLSLTFSCQRESDLLYDSHLLPRRTLVETLLTK